DYRASIQMPPDILGKLVDRSVAVAWFFSQRFKDDGVQVAITGALNASRSSSRIAANALTGRLGIAFADGLDPLRHRSRESKRHLARKQLIQNYAQRVRV